MSDTSDDDSAALPAATGSADKPSKREKTDRASEMRHIQQTLRRILKQAAGSSGAGAQPTSAAADLPAAGSGATGSKPTPAANATGFDAEEAAAFLSGRFRDAAGELIVEIARPERTDGAQPTAVTGAQPAAVKRGRIKMSQRRRRQARAALSTEQELDHGINFAQFERDVANHRGARCWNGHKLDCIFRLYEPSWPPRCAGCAQALLAVARFDDLLAVACKTCNFALCSECALKSGPLEPDCTAPWRL